MALAGAPAHDPDRRQRRIIWGAVAAAVLVAAVVTIVLLLRPSSQTRTIIIDPSQSAVTQPPTTDPPTNSLSTSTTSTTEITSTTMSDQSAGQEAQSLQSLLQSSTADRSAIISATADIGSCGDLSADVQTLDAAASGRQALLGQLTQLDLSDLTDSSQLVSTLTAAWQASIQSDTDYANWGSDVEQSGCTGQASTSDPNWQSAQSSDTSATFAKYEFVALWNPVAQADGLSQYQYNQL